MKYQVMILLPFMFLGGLWLQQDIPVTPEAIQINSIFDYDTCAPPCWMGITPGKSTSEDVEQMLQAHADLIKPDSISRIGAFLNGRRAIDQDTGMVITGSYYFDVGIVDLAGHNFKIQSSIEVHDRLVEIIFVVPNEMISLENTSIRLGNPDIVRLTVGNDNNIWLYLIYIEPRMRVNLNVPVEKCQIKSLNENTVINSVLYFSEEAATRLRVYSSDIPQPDLTGFRLLNERGVPLETWERWLSGEIDMSCEEAWAELPVPVIEAAPTPEIDSTSN